MPSLGVYAITPSDGRPESLLLEQVDTALAHGVALVQYRDKQANQARQRRLAEALTALCTSYHVPLLVNDSIELAQSAGAAGAHLGKQDSSVSRARAELGPHAIIGATCHADIPLAQQAIHAGASYVAFGRFFPSSTKPDAPAAPLATLNAASLGVPVVAIGGVNAANGAQLLAAGANLLAVSESIFGRRNIAAATRSLVGLFN